MTDDRTAAHQPRYRLRLKPTFSVSVEEVTGSELPVKLVLTVQDHLNLERAATENPQGAMLEIDMRKEVALELFSQIRALARRKEWKLPEEDKRPSRS